MKIRMCTNNAKDYYKSNDYNTKYIVLELYIFSIIIQICIINHLIFINIFTILFN